MNFIKEEFKLLAIIVLTSFSSCQLLDVNISDGIIRGATMFTRTNQPFYAFLNISYAAPPVGNLRFQAPEPVIPWQGIRDSTAYGPMCMMPDEPAVEMSEDCLQLNVYSKNLPILESSELKPVIVYIYGGAFERGAASENGPQYLMDRDIILVVPNYRLVAFGFLATGTADAPGNAGLKDQSFVLRWVQTNIHNFGGDPQRVTLAGLSAGAFSITAQMVSPMSQNLFHRIIALSGAITWKFPLRTEHLDVANRIATALNCTTATTELMMNCLRDAPAFALANVRLNNFPAECPVISWLPVIEPDLGQIRFLIEEPATTIRNENFTKVPVIIGITANEFTSPVAALLENTELLDTFNNDFENIAPLCFSYEAGTERSKSFSKKIREFYFPFDKIDRRSFNNLNELFADSYIGYDVYRFVQLLSHVTDVFYYKISYVGRFSVFNYPRDRPYGTHHVDDLQYVIYASRIGAMIQPTDPESFIVERMTRIWEQFAWNGNPHNGTDEYLQEMSWPKHDAENEFYLEIGTHLIEKNGLFLNRYKIWQELMVDNSLGITRELHKFGVVLALLMILRNIL